MVADVSQTPGGRLRSMTLRLDEAAGARLALFLSAARQGQGRRAHRADRTPCGAPLSREEAVYWLANITTADPVLRSWAVSGLRLMLCGDAGDQRLPLVLERIRARG